MREYFGNPDSILSTLSSGPACSSTGVVPELVIRLPDCVNTFSMKFPEGGGGGGAPPITSELLAKSN
jgi:hypothetical protein